MFNSFLVHFLLRHKMAASEVFGMIGGLSAYGGNTGSNFVAAPTTQGCKGNGTPIINTFTSTRVHATAAEALPYGGLPTPTGALVASNFNKPFVSSGYISLGVQAAGGGIAQNNVLAVPMAIAAPNVLGAFPVSMLVPIYANGTPTDIAALKAAPVIGFGLPSDTVITLQMTSGASPIVGTAGALGDPTNTPVVMSPVNPKATAALPYVLGYRGFDYTRSGVETSCYCIQITDASTVAGLSVPLAGPAVNIVPLPGFYLSCAAVATAGGWPVTRATIYSWRVMIPFTSQAPST